MLSRKISFNLIFANFILNVFSINLYASSYGVAELQGRRPTMEDAHAVLIMPQYAIFGLFDGHGGKDVSEFLSNNLINSIVADSEFLKSNSKALYNSYIKIDSLLDNSIAQRQGATAVTALVNHNKLYVANVGDSRAVICCNGVAVPLSIDHKPDRADEKKRIEDLGGKIIFHGVWRVQGNLAISRAIGDHRLSPYVIAEPEVQEHLLTNQDEFLILACDGVWDVLTNQQAVNIVRQSLLKDRNFDKAAKTLVDAAYNAGSTDNISVVVIDIQKLIK